jgi:hypothetical protein
MPPTSTKVLEEKIDSLEKRLEEAMGAIRKLSQQQISNIELLSRHEETISTLKVELQKAQQWAKGSTGNKLHENNITRYE